MKKKTKQKQKYFSYAHPKEKKKYFFRKKNHLRTVWGSFCFAIGQQIDHVNQPKSMNWRYAEVKRMK